MFPEMNYQMAEKREEHYYSLKNLANTYKLLEKRRPPMDQEYCIYAYFLYSEPIDGVHGKQIFLGGYPTKKKALEEVQKIMKKTGHDSIYMCETCSWENIDSVKRFDRSFKLDTRLKSEELQKQFEEEMQRKEEEQEQREQIRQEIEMQGEMEQDPTTLDHYVHNWFNTIKNKASYEYHKEQMEYYEKMYSKRANKVRQQYESQPEYEDQWLDVYEKRLRRRGEDDVFIMMKEGHKALKAEVLGIN